MCCLVRFIGLGCLLAISAVALAAVDSVNLQFSPKVGDQFNYKMTGKLHIMGGTAQISADIHYKVTKVDNDRTYTMSSSQTNMVAAFGGQTINPSDTSNITVNKANGELLDFQSDITDAAAWRMMELKHFVYPPKRVSVGDTWTSTVTADPKRGTVAATAKFEVDSIEKIGGRETAKVMVDYKETEGAEPASSAGFVWIDTSDGSMVKSETNWTNAPSAQGPIDGTIMLERA
jgi:hypothetical protein